MDYHAQNISQDDIIQMHVDGFAFRDIKWPLFKEEPRNIRIYLEANGVNPFAEMRFVYTVCLILLPTIAFLHGCQ